MGGVHEDPSKRLFRWGRRRNAHRGGVWQLREQQSRTDHCERLPHRHRPDRHSDGCYWIVNDAEAGARCRVSYINGQGGINGHPVKAITIDDQGNAADAAVAANQLVADHVVAIVGEYATATQTAWEPIF